MRIPDEKLREIADAADIVEVVSEYVTLKKAGKDYRGLCPFHGDKDPSFYVSPAKRIFHCFGCGTGGGVFNFLMRIENVGFIEAVKMTAKRYGIAVELDSARSADTGIRDRILYALKRAAEFFQECCASAEPAADYLENRGVSAEWRELLGLGFAPNSWQALHDRLGREKIAPETALAAGLVRERASGGYYDYFRSRIMIPIHALNGEIVAFGGRIVGEGEPKYLNSPESPVFNKRNTLFGLDSARDAVRREGSVIVVEGYFDQISLRIAGIDNVTAPLGTSLGRDQVKQMRRFAERAVTIFDADEAGIRAAKRAIPAFLAEGMEPRCVVLRDFKDPDDAVRSLGPDGFRKLVDESVDMIDFLLDSVEREHDLSTMSGRNNAVEECLPVIREIADSKERDYLLERFSNRLRVREQRLVELAFKERKRASQTSAVKFRSLFDFPMDECNVVRGMLTRDGFVDMVARSGIVKDLEDPVMSDLARRIVDFYERRGHFDAVEFCSSLEDEELASITARAVNPSKEEDNLRPEVDGDLAIDQAFDKIRLRKLEKRKHEIRRRMSKCTPCDEEFNRLAGELLQIQQEARKKAT